jgi:hypothetical protein
MYLCVSMIISATIILTLGLGHRGSVPSLSSQARTETLPEAEADAIIEPI